jgi:hypothetical protein
VDILFRCFCMHLTFIIPYGYKSDWEGVQHIFYIFQAVYTIYRVTIHPNGFWMWFSQNMSPHSHLTKPALYQLWCLLLWEEHTVPNSVFSLLASIRNQRWKLSFKYVHWIITFGWPSSPLTFSVLVMTFQELPYQCELEIWQWFVISRVHKVHKMYL